MLKRLTLVLSVFVVALAVGPGIASAATSVSKLRLGSSLGAEDYLYKIGRAHV